MNGEKYWWKWKPGKGPSCIGRFIWDISSSLFSKKICWWKRFNVEKFKDSEKYGEIVANGGIRMFKGNLLNLGENLKENLIEWIV